MINARKARELTDAATGVRIANSEIYITECIEHDIRRTCAKGKGMLRAMIPKDCDINYIAKVLETYGYQTIPEIRNVLSISW